MLMRYQDTKKLKRFNISTALNSTSNRHARKIHCYGWFIKLINFHFMQVWWIVMDKTKELEAICKLKYLTWESLCWRLMEWSRKNSFRWNRIERNEEAKNTCKVSHDEFFAHERMSNFIIWLLMRRQSFNVTETRFSPAHFSSPYHYREFIYNRLRLDIQIICLMFQFLKELLVLCEIEFDFQKNYANIRSVWLQCFDRFNQTSIGIWLQNHIEFNKCFFSFKSLQHTTIFPPRQNLINWLTSLEDDSKRKKLLNVAHKNRETFHCEM